MHGKKRLAKHPIEHGFHIGVDKRASFVSAWQNMQSAKENPIIVEEYLKEASKGNILGPFSLNIAPHVYINQIGAIPKKYQQGKWTLITNLSSLEGWSINDSLYYITVEEVEATAVALGKDSQIAKIDIKAAYHLIPVCAHDWKLLGMKWNRAIYIDGMLPFGLWSSQKVFNAVADGL